ncbi:MAG: NAD(P)/FAD-dependent oxidoreductase [Limnohabitans sp.]|nr:NAD(P)/FAD-dependent oxidoreductase [Limnohabitans sp.]
MSGQTHGSSKELTALKSNVDVVVVGAGFAGLYMLYRLRGLGLQVQVIEAGSGVGGTWFWNRYPGARCDVESMEYSYSFSEELQQEWDWTERYATQPEILRYINHVADRFDLRRDVQFNTRASSAIFDEATGRWTVTTNNGQIVNTQFCVMATGCLSAAKPPEIKGRDLFKGNTYHTGLWPHEPVDFTGKIVGVIGTGSSGVQTIPEVAKQAHQLFVFQRTPTFSLPAGNRPLKEAEIQKIKQNYIDLRKRAKVSPTGVASFPLPTLSALEATPQERDVAYEFRWQAGGTAYTRTYKDIMLLAAANETAADFARRKIQSRVKNPELAEKLTPRDIYIGTKRLCLDTQYFETFNKDNVSLVDIRSTPIQEITEAGVKTSVAEYKLDALIYATGFDAITGAILNIDIRTSSGLTLAEKWRAGPLTYLGLMTAGFPNLFMVTGPGSPSVLSNVIVSIEQHVEWISDCIQHLTANSCAQIEATQAAENNWVAHVNQLASATLFLNANSWYLGANVPGKPRVFMPYVGGVGRYREECTAIANNGYTGFDIKK